MVSNIAAILSITLFVINLSTCMWYVFSCDNLVKGGACQDQTWAGISHSHEGGYYAVINSAGWYTGILLQQYVLQTSTYVPATCIF